MKRKHALLAAIVILVSSICFTTQFLGCAKQSNPVSVQDVGMTLVASILTPGAPEAAAIYNDTLYVADDERGIAIIALKPEPHYLKNIITEANHGFIWVGYDSLRHKLLASDRASTTNRFLYNIFEATYDTITRMQGLELGNSSTTTLFHDPDTSLHFMKCHQMTDGFLIVTVTGIEIDTNTGTETWSKITSGAFFPNSRTSKIRHAVIGKPYTFAAAEEYGLIVLNHTNWTNAPVEVGHLDLPGSANWIAKHGNYAYVSLKTNGIATVDISNPTHPQLVSTVTQYQLDRSDGLVQVEVSADGSRLFAVDDKFYKGVYVLSLSNPANPVPMGLLKHNGTVAITTFQNYLVVCSEDEGVQIYRW